MPHFNTCSDTDQTTRISAAAGRHVDGGRARGVAGRGLGAGARGVPAADVPGEQWDGCCRQLGGDCDFERRLR
jgi:hypothetical protein